MMSMVLGMALLLASTPAFSSHPSGSVRDQYGKQTPHLAPEATDPEGDHRPKRSYSGQQVIYQMPYNPQYRVWKAPMYQISRPYFIPIFGVPGRVPIYYPPQPLLINPGVPQDNPRINYLPPKTSTPGPAYLPPVEHTTQMEFPNRFDDFDGNPIWDAVEDNRRVENKPSIDRTENVPASSPDAKPTRRPPRPGSTTHPPLIHDVPKRPSAQFETPSQSQRPPSSRTTERFSTTPAPISTNPTNCVWAIISCCSSGTDISYECFEQRGCVGAFWDRSPCESEFAKAAISSALNYYQSK